MKLIQKSLAADDPKHGNRWVYQKYGCRCQLCRTANSAKSGAWSKSQRRKRKDTRLMVKAKWVCREGNVPSAYWPVLVRLREKGLIRFTSALDRTS